MKMTDRIKRNMQPNKPMTMISMRVPEHVVDDLKEVAPLFGYSGYQALIKSYISTGLRKHLAQIEAKQAKDNTVEELRQVLIANGVSEQIIQKSVDAVNAAK